MTEARASYQCALLLSLLTPLAARADVLGAVNTLRAQGCAAHRSPVPAVRPSRALDAVAHNLAAGMPLAEAERRAGYHAVSSFAVSISGVGANPDVAPLLGREYCVAVMDSSWRELGVSASGDTVWLALAAPFMPPPLAERDAIAASVLRAVNAARARARRCGATYFGAAGALARSATLEHIAIDYATEMARHGYMSHTGRDGSSPAQRVSRGGYRWLATGENLARGIMRPGEVVSGWLGSPEHCANLMDPAYTELGVGFAVNGRDAAGVYWALELGRPRPAR